MIKSFFTKETEAIYNGECTKKTLKVLPKELHRIARIKIDQLDQAVHIEDMMVPPSNRLEKKSGEFKDYYAIRINDQYRILFKWTADNNAENVFIKDYH